MNITISEAVKDVKRRIAEAAAHSGRRSDEIILMAVSKTKPLEAAIEAASNGAVLGENYVQEFREKFDRASHLPWHFIGHLQKNKVKYVVPRAVMIHSVDSLALAEKIDAEGKKLGKTVDCLLEINSGGEINKFGLTIEETPYIIKEMCAFENIRLRGLMTVAPFVEQAEDNRPIFKKMKQLFDEGKMLCPAFDTLSMGMSGDFEVAVEEGATLVRVGTQIFGERTYATKE